MFLSYPNPGGSTGGTGRRSLAVSRLASASYALCFLVATILSVRRGHKAEALGIDTPFPVPMDAAVGIGTGLAAPWPLVAWLWRERRLAISGAEEGRRATAGLALLGALFLAGAAAEPVSHRLLAGRLRRDEAIIVTLNFVLPIAILGGALLSLVAKSAEPSTPVEPVEEV